jgi:mono/diheme cytochrome c family protein
MRAAFCAGLTVATLLTCSLAIADDIEAGKQMYRDGVLANGEPLTAIVAGDVEILGTQFSCESCHGRSGMGATEGKYIVPPIAAQFLYEESPQPPRPAYTKATLTKLLREGVTASGRELGELMPRYKLSDADIAALDAYLRTLSAGNSPGVDDTTLHFATAFAEGVDAEERAAVLAIIERFFDEINRQTRNEGERWDRGYTPESKLPTVFREWVLEEWTLKGPRESWDEQLKSYYREQPVFAMVGGLSDRGWGPVGRFCEDHEIACLYPGVDMPQASEGDFYTLYFSRGLGLEADLIATNLKAHPAKKVVQVFCSESAALAAGVLQRELQVQAAPAENLSFDCADPLPLGKLKSRLQDQPDTAVVLWVSASYLESLKSSLPGGRIYLSSTLLDAELPSSMGLTRSSVFMAHPFRLPGKPDPAMRRFAVWAKTRDIEVTHPRLQAEAFFACLVLNDAMKHIGRFFVRDFALDMLDHAQGLMAYLPVHPRPTIGPGQRFLTKGGYILPVVDGKADTKDAAWILP